MAFARFACLLALATVLCSACGAPPEKEMHQAQGAIEAARAAGAAEYAPQEFAAAVDAMTRSQEAVGQRDYRLALNHALDSRERAQSAAKQAADQKAIVRSEAERALNEAAVVLVQANTRLKQAETGRTSRKSVTRPREQIAAAESAVQEARAALERQDYLAARRALQGVAGRMRAAINALDQALAAQPPRRRR